MFDFYTPLLSLEMQLEIEEIIYTQERVGKTIFAILKFRSMRNNCESNGAVLLQLVIYA
jgi:lipopolysaccharide/colanic/teichoic acid biosynthesis glycosyltransferase